MLKWKKYWILKVAFSKRLGYFSYILLCMSGITFRTGASFFLVLHQHVFWSTFPWVHPLPSPLLRALLHLAATEHRRVPVAGAFSHFPGIPLLLLPGAAARTQGCIPSLLAAPILTLRALGSFTASRFPAQFCISWLWVPCGAAVPSLFSPIPSGEGQPQGFGVIL